MRSGYIQRFGFHCPQEIGKAYRQSKKYVSLKAKFDAGIMQKFRKEGAYSCLSRDS